MTGHELAMTRFSQYWRRAVLSGYADAEVSTRFRIIALPLWDEEARSNLVHVAGLLAMVVVAPLISQALHSMIPNRSGGCDHRGARDSHSPFDFGGRRPIWLPCFCSVCIRSSFTYLFCSVSLNISAIVLPPGLRNS